MKKPDVGILSGVQVDAVEMDTALDLDALGLSINDATKEAWVAVSEALSTSSTTDLVADSFDIEPGTNLRAFNRIVGAGIGTSFDHEVEGPPGSACVVLYIAEPMATQTAIDYAAAAFHADALTAEDAHVRVVHTGPIDLLSHRSRMRPAPGGISIAHKNVTAGTLGCLCTGRNAPRNERLLVLSNNHVLANVNQGHAGDQIYQPGPSDGGKPRGNRFGRLERYVTIHMEGQNDLKNYVDCATAWIDPKVARKELMYQKQGLPHYFRLSLPIVPARIGMTVGKSGRTTRLTVGRVDAIAVTIRVNIGDGRKAQFTNQISIQGLLTDDFSQAGDSGSVVWTWDDKRQPVGLLFAGGGGVTFANPINAVLDALDVDLLL